MNVSTRQRPLGPLIRREEDDSSRSSNLVERPFERDEEPFYAADDRTAEYNTNTFSRGEKPAATPSLQQTTRRSTGAHLKNARHHLDMFIKETSGALALKDRSGMSEFQRSHLTKIVTFIQALADRYDQVMVKR